MFNILKGAGVAFMLVLALVIFSMYTDYNSGVLFLIHSIPFGDKFCHFFVIGLLTFFANILLDHKKTEFFITPILLGSVFVFAFATLDEVTQMFFEHRNCELLDFVANYAGIYVFSKIGDQIPETIIPRRKVSLIP